MTRPSGPDTVGRGGLRTGSLRTRTVLSVLALLTVLLLALCFTVQFVLGERLRAQLEERLQDRASAAAALVGTVSNDDLASRLSAQGLSVLIESPDGGSVVAGPTPEQLRQGPDAAGLGPLGAPGLEEGRPGAGDGNASATGSGTDADPQTSSTSGRTIASSVVTTSDPQIVTLESTLSDDTVLTLSVGAGGVDQTLQQLLWIMLGASAVFLLLAAAALTVVVRGALHPLESMTAVARDIARGDRGRRLRPTRPRTEIGKVAIAFDEMLDGVEGAERAAVDSERLAREAEQRVRSFVSDAAHELRTPVSGMRAAADTLVRASVDRPERERLASHVVREAARASRLIDDMLMMARVDQGLDLRRAPLDIAEVVAREAERQRIRRPALELICTDDRSAPDAGPLDGDAERLSQVIANLVDNAARMTGGAGPVTVAIGQAEQIVRVEVRDRGPGVPPQDRSRIFDRLVRLDSARNASGGGAGLGLPIARGIARAHGGDVVCVDPPGGQTGAVFVLTLPVDTHEER